MAPAASGVTVARTGPSSPFQCSATGVFFGARANADPVTVTWVPAWPELELRFRAARFVHAKAAEARARTTVAAAAPATTASFLVTDGMTALLPPGTGATAHPSAYFGRDTSATLTLV